MTPNVQRSGVHWRPSLLFVVAAILAVLLPVLGYLQYRWLGKVSEREREQLQAGLKRSIDAFRHDFDREIARCFVAFQIQAPSEETKGQELGQMLTAALGRWNATAPFPGIVGDLYWNHNGDNAGQSTLKHWNTAKQTWEAADWEKELPHGPGNTTMPPTTSEIVSANQLFLWNSDRGGPLTVRAGLLQTARPAMSVPLDVLSFPAFPNPPAPLEAGAITARLRGLTDQAIVALDPRALASELIPTLVHRHFGASDPEYRIEIRDSRASTIYTSYTSDEPRTVAVITPVRAVPVDAESQLFDLRLEEYPDLTGVSRPGPSGPGIGLFRSYAISAPRGNFNNDAARVFTYRFAASNGLSGGLWRIRATHRSGSLDAAVEQGRLWNLFAAFGMLGLLGASIAIIVVSAARAQRLARQQIEFVSTVSHELRTPLAVICSAGENLADGLVRDPERLRGYGKLIRDEGRRLTETVEQALGFASLQSGLKRYALVPAGVRPIVENALAALDVPLQEGRFSVEVRIDDGLPEVQADAPAISRAIQNLIGNAMKYGGADRWIGVHAAMDESSGGRSRVRIDISDHGTGVGERDRPHVFKPFFRGRNAIDAQTQGSGLGLSVVQDIVSAHAGEVEVHSGPDGSTFSIVLPAADGETGT